MEASDKAVELPKISLGSKVIFEPLLGFHEYRHNGGHRKKEEKGKTVPFRNNPHRVLLKAVMKLQFFIRPTYP